MGRNKKKAVRHHGKQKNFNRGGGKVGEGYDLGSRDNILFAKYYKGQGFVTEDEWDEFYRTLQKTLPVTFRITGYKSQSQEMLNNIKGKFLSQLLDVKVDGEDVPPPKQIPWYPNGLAWQLDLSRKVVRSSEQLSRLHDFLIAETECGAISRQEAVSMIPPLVLDIQSHHKILDMCAAPGSKTAQLIEYLHSSCPEGELPKGFVIANDTDNKRCYLMVHQVKRLQSPCCVIVNHDGTFFPNIRANTDDSNPEFHFFDRVLCDVPCSGDGTMRKNFDVWNKWHPLQGANMHGLQLKILRRGCQLLAKGGRLVYSTCSLNPVEDEAVIAEMLRSSNGAMKLIDIDNMLPGLKFSKGISKWKVMTKTGEWINSITEIPAPFQTQFKSTIFPPTPEEAELFHLDKCIRILPHQQDTGGFFVAVLQKVNHLHGSRQARQEEVVVTEQSVSDAKPEAQDEDTGLTERKRKEPAAGEEPKAKKKKLHGYKEDPFLFMDASDPIWPSVRDFYGLREDFPVNQILFRSLQGKRTLYYVSTAIREITRCNEDRIRFINMGVKAFSRSPSPIVPDCDFRITQECLSTLLPEVTQRKVNITKNDAIVALCQENPFISKFIQETQNQLHDMSPGSTVFVFNPSESDPTPNCEVVFCGWRGKTSIRCFGSRCERAHALMLFGEDLNEINKRVEAQKKLKQDIKEQTRQRSTEETKDEEEELPTVNMEEENIEERPVDEIEDEREKEEEIKCEVKEENDSERQEGKTEGKSEEKNEPDTEEKLDGGGMETTEEKNEPDTEEKSDGRGMETTEGKNEPDIEEKSDEGGMEAAEEKNEPERKETTEERLEDKIMEEGVKEVTEKM